MRSVRSFQARVKGVKISRSPRNRTIAAAARRMRSCWRFLMFTAASFHPPEIERELERILAANLVGLDVRDFFGATQFIPHSEQSLVVAGHAGTDHLRLIADFQ